jgi:hypothetical protein
MNKITEGVCRAEERMCSQLPFLFPRSSCPGNEVQGHLSIALVLIRFWHTIKH